VIVSLFVVRDSVHIRIRALEDILCVCVCAGVFLRTVCAQEVEDIPAVCSCKQE
jgi:hypothetical protein